MRKPVLTKGSLRILDGSDFRRVHGPFIPLLALLVASLFFVACDRHDGGPISPVSSGVSGKSTNDAVYLANLWERSDHGDYDVLTADIDMQRGGKLVGTADTWRASDIFEVIVPASALQVDPLDPYMTFSLHVPRHDPSDPERPGVFMLEPDGVEFVKPVTVTVHYPSWLVPWGDWRKYCIVRDEGSGQEPVYSYTDYEEFPRTPGQRKVTFTTKHFSRWPLGNSKDGPDGD